MASHSPSVQLRLRQDNIRYRLSELDRLDGGDRVLRWTLETWHGIYYLELPPFTVAKLQPPIFNKENKMGRTVGAKNKSTVAAQLLEALNFISMAATGDNAPYKTHVLLTNKQAVMFNGQITCGHPIVEDLNSCPQFDKLKAAISKCGKSLAISELDTGKMSIVGDKLRALVDCLPEADYPTGSIIPDANIAPIDDRLKVAFAVCGATVSETGTRMVECALMLEANECTATDGKVLIQYWHGINLPPKLVIPKTFAAAVCKTKSPLKGFGWTEGRSITFHFENGAWIKTRLYEDKYPDVAPIINKETNAIACPADLFEAIVVVSDFNQDGYAMLKDGKVVSHVAETTGAQYDVAGLQSGLTLVGEQVKLIAGIATKIDLTTYPDRAFFFGENVRGVIMGVTLRTERAPIIENEPSGSETHKHIETEAEWRERGGNDDEIPF